MKDTDTDAVVVFALADPIAGAGRMLEIPYVRRHVVTYHESLRRRRAGGPAPTRARARRRLGKRRLPP